MLSEWKCWFSSRLWGNFLLFKVSVLLLFSLLCFFRFLCFQLFQLSSGFLGSLHFVLFFGSDHNWARGRSCGGFPDWIWWTESSRDMPCPPRPKPYPANLQNEHHVVLKKTWTSQGHFPIRLHPVIQTFLKPAEFMERISLNFCIDHTETLLFDRFTL